MTQEHEDLLLKDLCARLPYGVILNCCEIVSEPLTLISYKGLVNNDYDIDEVKPYLFPLSSMTKEQESYLYFNTKFRINMFGDLVVKVSEDDNYCYTDIIDYVFLIDWLNKNHFDYRGLIPMGLAEDVTGLNIY